VAGAELTMQTDTLRATVLPALGGKIASLVWLRGNVELLQAPLAPYAARTLTMPFDEGDASGFDECLPSVAACAVAAQGATVQVPDHGDFWRLGWEATQEGNSIRMAATGVSLPLRFERLVTLEGNALGLSYRVTNVGQEPAPGGRLGRETSWVAAQPAHMAANRQRRRTGDRPEHGGRHRGWRGRQAFPGSAGRRMGQGGARTVPVVDRSSVRSGTESVAGTVALLRRMAGRQVQPSAMRRDRALHGASGLTGRRHRRRAGAPAGTGRIRRVADANSRATGIVALKPIMPLRQTAEGETAW
jgi:hypothetical protein